MKRLLLISLIGFTCASQICAAASSSSSLPVELPPVNYTGTLSALAQATGIISHTGIREAYSLTKLEATMKFYKPGGEDLINRVQLSHAYTSYPTRKNIHTYMWWGAGIFAALNLGLYKMHTAEVLRVNWKHIALCAALASCAGIYAAYDNSAENNNDARKALISLRINPTLAVQKLAYGYYQSNVNATHHETVFNGYFNQISLGTEAELAYKKQIEAMLPGLKNVPARDLSTIKEADLYQIYQHVYQYLGTNLASDEKLGTLLAAHNNGCTMPASIPLATTAVGLVAGIGLIRDTLSNRMQ